MTNTIRVSHADCDHDATPSGRAACRQSRRVIAAAHAKRRDNILSELDIPFSSGTLIARVCSRYSRFAEGEGNTHSEHDDSVACAEMIIRYIDYTRVHSNYVVPETDFRRHAYRMFS